MHAAALTTKPALFNQRCKFNNQISSGTVEWAYYILAVRTIHKTGILAGRSGDERPGNFFRMVYTAGRSTHGGENLYFGLIAFANYENSTRVRVVQPKHEGQPIQTLADHKRVGWERTKFV
jgi:hypothetical protein